MQEERADSGQFQQVLRLPRQQAQAKSDNLLLETYRFVFSRLSRCNKPEILRKNRGRGQRRTRCLASWNTETWCETPFKNSRNARTRAHTHPYTRARAPLHRYKEGTEETSKWRVQFLARIEHEGFIGGAAEFFWNLTVKKIGYPVSKNLGGREF